MASFSPKYPGTHFCSSAAAASWRSALFPTNMIGTLSWVASCQGKKCCGFIKHWMSSTDNSSFHSPNAPWVLHDLEVIPSSLKISLQRAKLLPITKWNHWNWEVKQEFANQGLGANAPHHPCHHTNKYELQRHDHRAISGYGTHTIFCNFHSKRCW